MPSRTRIVLSRRGFLQAAAATTALAPLGLAACGDDPVLPPGGDPVPVPPLLDGELIDGVRVFRLTIAAGTVEWVAGAPTATIGVNGAYLGPTLHFRRGERVRLEVTNQLAEVTSLHWHGMELPARADGGPYQPIAPGATWISEYDVVQPAATTWYHAHPMHSTGRHVYLGLAGLIVIEDPAATVELPMTYGVDDLPLVIQDRRLFADGTHPYSAGGEPAMHDMMAGLRGATILVNGVIEPTGEVPRGLVRLRVLNGANARAYHLGFADDRPFVQIASDGGLLPAPVTTTRALLGPGERAELLVDFGADPAGATVELRSYSGEAFGSLFTGMMGANLADSLDRATFAIMTFTVGAAPHHALTAPTALPPIARMTEADAVRTRTLALSMGMGAVAINGVRMMDLDVVPAEVDFRIPTGDTELWRVTNSSGMAHPLHVHHRQFQILDVDGRPPAPALAGWKDTVLVGPGQVVRLMIRFAGVADPTYPFMFHCHILEHEDMGMMGRFFLVAPTPA